jgi:hypothetical protein
MENIVLGERLKEERRGYRDEKKLEKAIWKV